MKKKLCKKCQKNEVKNLNAFCDECRKKSQYKANKKYSQSIKGKNARIRNRKPEDYADSVIKQVEYLEDYREGRDEFY